MSVADPQLDLVTQKFAAFVVADDAGATAKGYLRHEVFHDISRKCGYRFVGVTEVSCPRGRILA